MMLPSIHKPAAPGIWSDALIGRLRTAMSSPAMLDILRRDWGYLRSSGDEILDCQLVRVFPRSGNGFALQYEVTLRNAEEERRELLIGEIADDPPERRYREAVRRLRKPKRKQLSGATMPHRLALLPVPGMVLRFPGLDERLIGLKLIHNPSLLKPVLSEHVAAPDAAIGRIEPEILGHRPGKRCILRLRFEARASKADAPSHGSVIAKLYKSRTERAQQVFTEMQQLRARAFGDGSSMTVPAPIAYLPEEKILLMEDVPGVPLAELSGPSLLDGFAAAGRALAELHGSAVVVSGRHTVEDEIALLAGWVALVRRVHPHLAAVASDTLAAVCRSLDAHRNAETTLVHRDFYEKQVLIDRSRTTLIDFDTLCMADPALDLGNFLAHLQLRDLQGQTPRQDAADVFLRGYRDGAVAASDPRVLSYTGSSLLRLGCLYSFWPRWRSLVRPLMEASLASTRHSS